MNNKATHRITTIRKELRISKYELTRILKIRASTINNIERGEIFYTKEQFLKLYEYFKIKLGETITVCNIHRINLDEDFSEIQNVN